ncbi:limbic system-associated membrane protein-like [Lycorma delicatula]|uniref:limbic system-associated membrane protein-like n=1 Tax=Lycorma delicatula TaxID=130591 RepID=UPI003F514DC3
MRNNLWIFLALGVVIGQGFAHPAEDPDKDYSLTGDDDDEQEGPAPVLLSKNETFTFDVGKNARLSCKVENDKSGVIMWDFNGNNLWSDKIVFTASEHPNFRLEDDHSLRIINITSRDSGTFKCSVIYGEHIQAVLYKVEVAVPPKIVQFSPDSNKVTVDKGHSLTLICEANGFPTPVVSWYKKTKHNEENIGGSKVQIGMVNRKHSGTYECRASNNKGEYDTRSIDVHVLYEPEVEVESDVVLGGEGYESELVCTVHGEPKAKVTWVKDELPLLNNHNHITLEDKGNKHFLKISGTKRSDFGSYKCIGQNSKGNSSKTITLSGIPSRPKFQAAEEASGTGSPVLTWAVDSYAPISIYELLYRLQDKGEWKSIDVPVEGSERPGTNTFIAKHTLNELEPGTYQAQLRAKNIYGWSELSELHTFSGNVVNSEEPSETGLKLESSVNNSNAASELRISLAFVASLLIAQFYC